MTFGVNDFKPGVISILNMRADVDDISEPSNFKGPLIITLTQDS